MVHVWQKWKQRLYHYPHPTMSTLPSLHTNILSILFSGIIIKSSRVKWRVKEHASNAARTYRHRRWGTLQEHQRVTAGQWAWASGRARRPWWARWRGRPPWCRRGLGCHTSWPSWTRWCRGCRRRCLLPDRRARLSNLERKRREFIFINKHIWEREREAPRCIPLALY